MKKCFLSLTAIFLILAILLGCQKEDTTPTYHKDIFRCKVNGVEWVATCPSDGLFGCEPIDCQYYWKDTKGIEISGVNRSINSTTYQSMRVYTRPIVKNQTNEIWLLTEEFKDWNKPAGCRFHDLDTTANRRLTILEVDTVKFLIKGTFEYTAINECQDTMHITDGYFHVNFRF